MRFKCISVFQNSGLHTSLKAWVTHYHGRIKVNSEQHLVSRHTHTRQGETFSRCRSLESADKNAATMQREIHTEFSQADIIEMKVRDERGKQPAHPWTATVDLCSQPELEDVQTCSCSLTYFVLTITWLFFFLNLIVHNIGTIASCECYSSRGENFERRVCEEIPKSPKRWVFRWHFKHKLGYKLGRYAMLCILSGTIKCT